MKSTIIHTLIFIATIFSFQLHAQCGITVEAGSDLFVCNPGQVANLMGQVSGNFAGLQWTPVEQVIAPNNPNTPAFINGNSTTFTLTGFGSEPIMNLVVNGDFSEGETGFSSSYSPGSGGSFGLLSNEGEYAVASNASDTHNNFAGCTDHTGNNGNMMVVNGSTTLNQSIWCQSITVEPNQGYAFSAYVATVQPENPAILQFSINGQLLGNNSFNASSSLCNWSEFSEVWSSGSASSAMICITNQNTAGSGNDFAIDDIIFGPVCSASDEVTVSLLDIEAVINPTGQFPCNSSINSITLNGTGSSVGPGIVYQWSTSDGSIVNGGNTLTPEINQPGTYTLNVSYPPGGDNCFETASITVTQNTNTPNAVANTSDDIDCNDMIVTISGEGSSQGNEYAYEWTTMNGNIVGASDMLTIQVDTEGTYTLTVTNTMNNCSEAVDVSVMANHTPPVVFIIDPEEITCTQEEVFLDATNSDSGGDFTFFWNTVDGNFVSGINTLSPSVDMAGTYELTIENTNTGCMESASVLVTGDHDQPVVNIEPAPPINCHQMTIFLNGNGSSQGNNFIYDWSTFDGNILNGNNTLDPEINAPGTYTLTVTNVLNDCFEAAMVTVGGNNTPPLAVIAPPHELDCNTEEISLNATGSSMGADMVYEWTSEDGNIILGENTLLPSIDAGGTYDLMVTDNSTGCTSMASVTVIDNDTEPIIEFIEPSLLACGESSLTIDATLSSSGDEFAYTWTTTNGNMVSGENTLLLNVDANGLYELRIENLNTGCAASDTIEVFGDTNTPIADAGEPMVFLCRTDFLTLDGTNSDTGNNLTYQWTTNDGNIVSDETTLTPIINQVGTYILTIIDLNNDCEATDLVEIVADFTPPIADAGTPQSLTCAQDSLTLDASHSDNGNDITYLWTSQNGNILSGQTTLFPTVNASGTYQLQVTNNTTGCADTATIFINENITPPIADAGADAVITCEESSLVLNGNNSSAAHDFSVMWETMEGQIEGAMDSLMINVSTTGTYVLSLTDNVNGCMATDTVIITENTNPPMAVIADVDTLTCAITAIVLNGEASSTGNEFFYQWQTQNGNIVMDATSLSPTVNETGTYELTITNNNNGCTASTTIDVPENTSPPTADAGQSNTLTCAQPTLILNGNNSDTGNIFTYQWQTQNGNIVLEENTLTPTIDAIGIYELTVTNTNNGCTATSTVDIDENVAAPTADAGSTAELSCTLTEIILDGGDSQTGNGITYQWTTPNGNIIANAEQINPTINAAGDYILAVTDISNGCSATSTVSITQDDSTPTAAAGTAEDLTCLVESLNLDGSNSSMGNNFTYLWTTDDGNIVSGETTLMPNIDAPGVYVITVFNQDNNCQSFSSVTVVENINPPLANAGIDAVLTCTTDNLNLDASASSSDHEFSYAWTTDDGNIVSGATTAQPLIDATGIYTVLITNDVTGCTATDMVMIGEDENIPTVAASVMDELTCRVDTVLISGLGSDMGTNFDYQWTSPNGTIIANANLIEVEVSAAGMYELEVTNTDNGCTNTATVEVMEDLTPPNAHAGNDEVLDCQITSLNLDASNSDQGNIYTYQWQTSNGNITNGATTLNPSIDQAGNYELLVTNTDNGCTATDEVQIENDENAPHAVIAEAEMLNCVVTALTLDASASDNDEMLILEWTTNNGNILSDENTLTPTINQAGIYTLKLTNPENGCRANTSITILEDTVSPNVDAGTATVLNCNLPQITLNGSSDGTNNLLYEWITTNGQIISGNSTLNAVVNQAGTYTLTVTNIQNGCTTMDAVTVIENNPTAFDFDINVPNCVKPTGDISFLNVEDGVVPYFYSIDGGQTFETTPNFTNLETGNYQLIVQDANGCELAESVFLPATTEIQIALEELVALKLGENYALNALVNIPETDIATVTWSPSDSLTCSDCLNPIATPAETTIYQVYLEDINGCTAEADITLLVDKEVAVYIPNAFSPAKNGKNDIFYIHAKDQSVKEVQSFLIFDRWGEIVFEDYNFQANNPAHGWNGLSVEKSLNSNVFLYVAVVEMVDGRMELLKGDVTLVR